MIRLFSCRLWPGDSVLELVKGVVDAARLTKRMQNPKAGALVAFEGWVRNTHHHRPVKGLFYEAVESLAHQAFAEISQECLNQFEVLDVLCAHRLGYLEVGECAVWLGVTAPHRAAAFAASEYAMAQLKKRVAIWKQEHFQDGTTCWVMDCGCAAPIKAAAF